MSEKRPPSKERLLRALREGDSPLSVVALRGATFGAFVLLAPALGRAVTARFGELLRAALSPGATAQPTALVGDVATLAGPVVATLAGVAIVVGLAQTSGMVAFRRTAPRLDRLGARFIHGRPYEALRGAAVFVGLVIVAAASLRGVAPALANSIGRAGPLKVALGGTLRSFGSSAFAFLAVVAAADIVVQRAAWRERWGLSPREAIRERREQEGDPEMRRARRRVHEELLR